MATCLLLLQYYLLAYHKLYNLRTYKHFQYELYLRPQINLIIRCFIGGLLTEHRSFTKENSRVTGGNSRFTRFNYGSVSTRAVDRSRFLTRYKTLRKQNCTVFNMDSDIYINCLTLNLFAPTTVGAHVNP